VLLSTVAVAEFRGAGKVYRNAKPGAWAVRDVSLKIEAGEVVGLLGPNRAGKTTLVKLLLSLCHPTAGEVFRFDRPVDVRRTLARVGYVHEAPAFPRDLTAEGLLRYYGALSLVPTTDLRRRVPALLERVGLADRPREPIGRFSKGMIQRLGLAQALLNEPDLLVLDEPTEGLDLSGRQLVREIVSEQRQRGATVLLVSHAHAEVDQLCDRVIVLVEGRVVHDGSLENLKQDPAVVEPLAPSHSASNLMPMSASPSVSKLEQALGQLYGRPAE